jgi:hypothetical protein
LDVRQILRVATVQQHGPHVGDFAGALSSLPPEVQQGTQRAGEETSDKRGRIGGSRERPAVLLGRSVARKVCRSLARTMDAVVQKEHYAGRVS